METIVVRIASLILLIALLPILFLVAIIILLFDGFPIIFVQKRVGQNNNHFWIYKFRTMKKDMEDIATHLLKDKDSVYILFGPLLRKLSLDELPQLINILKGDMTFIGPRPALYNQSDLIELRTQSGIHKLMPGVTGWAQVNGRDKLSIHDKVKMDEYYLNNKTVWLDIKIIFMTLKKAIKAEDVLH